MCCREGWGDRGEGRSLFGFLEQLEVCHCMDLEEEEAVVDVTNLFGVS
jgi:hypothetical protein